MTAVIGGKSQISDRCKLQRSGLALDAFGCIGQRLGIGGRPRYQERLNETPRAVPAIAGIQSLRGDMTGMQTSVDRRATCRRAAYRRLRPPLLFAWMADVH
jgi:hypothetical protein